MTAVIWTIAFFAAFQMLFVWWNLRNLPRLHSPEAGSSYLNKAGGVRLSVLIPARNEAANIEACINSIVSQTGARSIEILVLDDHSDDGTGDRVKKIAETEPRVKLLTGKSLPEGWMGKSYACHQLASEAKGEWWLFVDADARLEQGALQWAVGTALEQKNGLVTGFPRQKTGTWLERLIVPLMMFTVACHLPIRLVRNSADPKFVAAHGAFMLIHANTYAETGGHAAFKDHLVDDMQLARAVKKAGHPVRLSDLTGLVNMRMYHSATEVWDGYKKNIYAGLGRRPALLLAVLFFYALIFILPPIVCLLSGVLAFQLFLPALIAWSSGILTKLQIDLRTGQSWWLSLLLPISLFIFILLAVSSWRTSADAKKSYVWKGRNYS